MSGCFVPMRFPLNILFFQEWKYSRDYFEREEEEGLAIVLDCSDLKRLGHLKDHLKEIK
jgi:hypothetical protein